ncbi:MAG: endonuclease domain-containing protein [Myxococcota bacterium]
MPTNRQLVLRARANRKNMTAPERMLWSRVRKRRLGGFKFRRQHVMYPFIVDFYCASEKLVVEIDGERHDAEEIAAKDALRDEYLAEEYGVEVLRFTNDDVYAAVEWVLSEILGVLEGAA